MAAGTGFGMSGGGDTRQSGLPQLGRISKKRLWTGWAISALPAALMLSSAVNMFFKVPQVVEGVGKLGYPEDLIFTIAVLQFISALLYVVPRTAILGAVLVTAYLGGATASHVRIHDPQFVGAVIAGILAWIGLYLRDRRVHLFLPLRPENRNWQ